MILFLWGPASPNVSFTNDALGRMVSGEDENTTETNDDDVVSTWAYDTLGRVIEESQKIGSGTARVSSSSYTSIRRTALTYPNGRVVEYGYHPYSNLLNTIEDSGAGTPITTYDYLGGRVLKRAMQNNVNLYVTYDAAGQPVEWIHRDDDGTTIVVGFQHAFDRAGNKLAQVSLHAPLDSQRYAYDSANRLTAYSRGQYPAGPIQPDTGLYCDAPTTPTWPGMVQTQNWKYDGLGNWDEVKVTTSGGMRVENRFNTSFNEYYSVDGKPQEHDDNGNQVFDGSKTFSWDAFNRLRSASDTTGTIATYLYDVANRRMRKDIAAGRPWTDIDYAYTGWQGVEQYEGGSLINPKRQFVYGNYIDEPLAMDVNGDNDSSCMEYNDDNRYFYHQNTIYSVYGLTDRNGNIVEWYEYDPYGRHVLLVNGNRNMSGASTVENSYLFTGREFDAEIENNNVRNRITNLRNGRFNSRDTTGYIDGNNIYQYCESNPVNFIDPFGLLSDTEANALPGISSSEQAWDHYRYGNGESRKLSGGVGAIQNINSIDLKMFIGGLIQRSRPSQTEIIDVNMIKHYSTQGDQSLFLGDVSLRLVGKLIIKCSDTWEFSGELKAFDDYYDFNASNHRGPVGEVLTTIARGVSGTPYFIAIRGSVSKNEKGKLIHASRRINYEPTDDYY